MVKKYIALHAWILCLSLFHCITDQHRLRCIQDKYSFWYMHCTVSRITLGWAQYNVNVHNTHVGLIINFQSVIAYKGIFATILPTNAYCTATMFFSKWIIHKKSERIQYVTFLSCWNPWVEIVPTTVYGLPFKVQSFYAIPVCIHKPHNC